MMRLSNGLLVALSLWMLSCAARREGTPQDDATPIRLNQVGFYPEAPKKAVVAGSPGEVFHVIAAERPDTVFTDTLGAPQTWPYAGETVRPADFSALAAPGTYVVDVPGLGRSHPFEVGVRVHEDAARAALKSYYFQRASAELPEAYAGPWARPAGHPDDDVRVHASAASPGRPAGTSIASPGGWYDAGDYNKYVVNSGITTGTLLMLYEHFPAYFAAFEVGIPERGGALPDLLDEVLWNLRWMLTMQDPADGGVYHKLTNARFDGFVMPDQATEPRYVVQKTTTAALDFAAVTAIAARVFDDFGGAVPGLADSCLAASQAAWNWARRNPAVYYDQRALSDPAVETGAYGDRSAADEFRWAAAELYVTTRRDSFLTRVDPLPGTATVPEWPNVGTMGVISLAAHRADVTPAVDTARVREALVGLAEKLVGSREASAYDVVMGVTAGDFVWGSNAVAANQGMVLVQAYRLTSDRAYLDAALSNLDYLLGRNPTGYSFLTGFGSKTPLHPHHRPSEADAVAEPVPGLLVGGPNPSQQDRRQAGCDGYPSELPALSYLDHVCSYASNEVAINWNAPMVYLTGALEALLSPTGLPAGVP